MGKLKPMKRAELTAAIEENRDQLLRDVFMVTSFRGTRDNSIQVEVCQNRLLEGKKQTLLGALNRSNKKFSSDTTLLFDWLTLEIEDFKRVFPSVDITAEQLKEVASKWSPTAPTGTEATVYASLQVVDKAIVNGEPMTPHITVTEVTHSQLENGEFFRGENADAKIEAVIENGKAVMRTGSGDDADFLVHPETGEKVYRFTRTEFKENNPVDTIIKGKVTLSQFNKGAQRNVGAKKSVNLNDILNQPTSI